MSTRTSPAFEGAFGRMFRLPRAAQFGDGEEESLENLAALGKTMAAAPDPPKDGKDEEESGIPALYTYLGQFIDHDLTFDPASSLQKQNDPDALVDYRTPAFDLDCIYGRGPADQPYLYDGDQLFLLGDPLRGGSDPDARDLPRNNANPRRALIGDPRNDENSIVSQLQGLFLRFHNRMVAENPGRTFAEIQQLVRFHYQYVILNDFLPRIVHSSVLDGLKSGGRYDRDKLEFFRWKNDPFMPVEFSVAAYRFGHSMVRPGYRLNNEVLLPIVAPEGRDSLTGFGAMSEGHGIDWGRFIDVDVRKYDGSDDDNKRRLQFGYRIDTSLVDPLAALPPSIVPIGPGSLAERNLIRGWRLGLPSGQSVAEAMGIVPLRDEEILIGQAVDEPEKPLGDMTNQPKVFAKNCPLWTYILAEAMQHKEDVEIPVEEEVLVKTPRLGPVGGRIVAEVFLGLMFEDRHSMLSIEPEWKPDEDGKYRLKNFVSYAVGQ
jgi:hypothetical protein